MTTQLPILTVKQTDAPFQRFFIEDEKDRVWTGSQLEPSGCPALYATPHSVSLAYQKILKGYFPGVEPIKYVAPVIVEVYSHEPVSLKDVAQYISRTCHLQLDTWQNGNGPGSSLVLPRIEWHRMTERKERPNV